VWREGTALCVRGTGELHGIDADMSAMGELVPTMSALCALADSPSRLTGVAHLRGHETDRLKALATELTKVGARTGEVEDGAAGRGSARRRHRHHAEDPAGLRGDVAVDAAPGTGGGRRVRRSAREYDESDVRVRPQRRGSRPRTKDRPKHEDAVTARVVSVDRGRWRTVLAEGTDRERAVTAMRARELGRSPIVPGDLVGLVGDTSGRDGTLARIVRIRERSSFLRRSADDDDATERPLVANVDLMV